MNLAWYVARAAGIVSWALLALSVGWGLLLSTSVLGRHPGPRWLLDVHRFLGGLSVIFVAVHVVALLADQYVPFTPTQVLVPLTADYRPAAVAAGIVGLYLLVAVEVTSLLRRHIPRRAWRAIHLLSYALFALGTAHLLLAGTDATNPVLLATVVVVTTLVALGTVAHVIQLRRPRPRPTRPAAPVAPDLLGSGPAPGWPSAPPIVVPVRPEPVDPVRIGASVGGPSADGSTWVFPAAPPVRAEGRR